MQNRSTLRLSREEIVPPGASWAVVSGSTHPRIPLGDALAYHRGDPPLRAASLRSPALRGSVSPRSCERTGCDRKPQPLGCRVVAAAPYHLDETGKSRCRAPARIVDAAQPGRALPSPPAGAVRALSLRPAPLRRRPRQRERPRRAGHPLHPRVLLRRPRSSPPWPTSTAGLGLARPGRPCRGPGPTTPSRTVAEAFARRSRACSPCRLIPSRPTWCVRPLRQNDLRPLRPQRLLHPAHRRRASPLTPARLRHRTSASSTAAAEIARHRRSYDRRQRIEDPAHLRRLLAGEAPALGLDSPRQLLRACARQSRGLAGGRLRARRVGRRRRPSSSCCCSTTTAPAELAAAIEEALARKTAACLLGRLPARAPSPRRERPLPLPVDLSRRPDLADFTSSPMPRRPTMSSPRRRSRRR